MEGALSALLLLPPACAAETMPGATAVSATRQLSFKVVVPPVMRVVQVTPLKDGYEYRIWTNTRSASFNGREYHFSRVGEYTLKVPSSPRGVYLIHGL
ncbi:hypothetical protein [Variovorax sp. OV700]|uniref:hypothetical protein n=1 Tax=Variovorax sp. OV700 TaxID=1882826 RepID=UPI0008919852|nr:hypothetical protein [Variovorax sp. OV700]SDH79749.1 hypothetical protein SAMN05444748_102473 [Variovorax sp. OV700]